MSYIPSWCKRKYTQGIYSKGLYQNVLKISLVGFTKANCIKALAESKQYNRLKPFYTTKSRTTNHVALIVDLWSPIQHMQSIKLNTIKTQYGKKKELLRLNIRETTLVGLLCFIQIRPGLSIQQSWASYFTDVFKLLLKSELSQSEWPWVWQTPR